MNNLTITSFIVSSKTYVKYLIINQHFIKSLPSVEMKYRSQYY